MQFSRPSWIVSICALAVLAGASTVQAQQYKLLPNDTEMIITINLQQILKSEVAKSNKEILEIVKAKVSDALDDKGVGKYLKKADFDLFRDMHSMTVAVPGGRSPEEVFILLEGNFDAEKIEAAATEASKDAGGGLKTTRIANVTAYEVSPKDEKAIYIGVLNKKTMIAAATKTDFSEAVARFNGTKESALKSEVKALIGTVNNKQSLSAIATGSVLAKIAESAPQNAGGDQAKMAMTALKQLDGLSLTITIQKNIDFQVGVNTQDNKTASKFADMGNLFITGARLKIADQAKQDEKFVPVAEVLSTLKASAQGNNLMIRGQITFETLAKIIQNLPINK